jgi:hypothetical protein
MGEDRDKACPRFWASVMVHSSLIKVGGAGWGELDYEPAVGCGSYYDPIVPHEEFVLREDVSHALQDPLVELEPNQVFIELYHLFVLYHHHACEPPGLALDWTQQARRTSRF